MSTMVVECIKIINRLLHKIKIFTKLWDNLFFEYWENIFYGRTPITLTDINYINEKYGECDPYFSYRGKKIGKKIKDILGQEYIFIVRDLEIL